MFCIEPELRLLPLPLTEPSSHPVRPPSDFQIVWPALSESELLDR